MARVAMQVERSKPSGSRPIYDRGRWFAASAGYVGIRTCIVTTTVTGRVGSTMGTGVVKLLITDASAGTETASTDPLDIFTVRNSYTASFAADANKRRKVHFEGGVWKILMGEC